ncbi:alpha/beta fold hydrolase [Paenibacillus sp. OAE614]|uniref:thioesterase II family protein n=1 Tax=Paenibacillus sp. OAE614 TaxID=2663804 RepID=UPI0017899BCE
MINLKLFCIPYAGASATVFNKWKRMNKNIEVVPIELRGRGSRISEPLYNTFDEAVDDVYLRIIDQIDDYSEYALFGHSMGGLLVFELAHRIANQKIKMPKKIIISGCTCPLERKNNQIHLLPNELFFKEIFDLGGTNALVFENDELKDLFGPILRADYKITEEYKANNHRKLEKDLYILFGNTDVSNNGNKLMNWKKETNGRCHFQKFEGGHFFVIAQEIKVLNYLNSILAV